MVLSTHKILHSSFLSWLVFSLPLLLLPPPLHRLLPSLSFWPFLSLLDQPKKQSTREGRSKEKKLLLLDFDSASSLTSYQINQLRPTDIYLFIYLFIYSFIHSFINYLEPFAWRLFWFLSLLQQVLSRLLLNRMP